MVALYYDPYMYMRTPTSHAGNELQHTCRLTKCTTHFGVLVSATHATQVRRPRKPCVNLIAESVVSCQLIKSYSILIV